MARGPRPRPAQRACDGVPDVALVGGGARLLGRARGDGEAPSLEPYLVAEYDLAYKVKVPLAGMSVAQIERKLEEIVAAADEVPRSPAQSGAAVLQQPVIE